MEPHENQKQIEENVKHQFIGDYMFKYNLLETTVDFNPEERNMLKYELLNRLVLCCFKNMLSDMQVHFDTYFHPNGLSKFNEFTGNLYFDGICSLVFSGISKLKLENCDNLLYYWFQANIKQAVFDRIHRYMYQNLNVFYISREPLIKHHCTPITDRDFLEIPKSQVTTAEVIEDQQYNINVCYAWIPTIKYIPKRIELLQGLINELKTELKWEPK